MTAFCGCCGRACQGEWCARCWEHVLPAGFGVPAWDRTFFAQFHRDCPFQIHDVEKHSREDVEQEKA